MHKSQALINHVALVLDGSGSMQDHQEKVVQVADAQIQHLALKSEELHQETRVSVYWFDAVVECLIFDMDVMRLPSIADLYKVRGMTAMIDAAMKSQEDLRTTSQIYGDHGFLTIVITDGLENASRRHGWVALAQMLRSLPAGHSFGFLVPKPDGRTNAKFSMTRMGIGAEYIQEWDSASADGFVQAGAVATASMDNFMTSRASGLGVMRSAFSTGEATLNTATVESAVRSAALAPLPAGKFTLLRNSTPQTHEMKGFVEYNGLKYRHGTHYYQLGSNRALVQPTKNIVVVNKKTQQAFSDSTPGSPAVRDMIGLSRTDRVSVSADANREFFVFVQSTATNRHVKTGMHALTLDPVTA